MRKPTTKVGRIRKWIRKKFSKKAKPTTYYQSVTRKKQRRRGG